MDKPSRGIAISILSKMKPPTDLKDSSDFADSYDKKMSDDSSPDDMDGMELAAEDIIRAIKRNDTKLLADALRSAVSICGDHDE